MKAALSGNELARLPGLYQHQILGTDTERAFDDIAHLAAQICGTPIAAIDLTDANRQWFKAKISLDITKIPCDAGLSQICIQKRDLVIISDTLADRRTVSNPTVTSYPYVRFYAGAPLISPEGRVLGALSVFDLLPREISQEQAKSLRVLSRQLVTQLELRRHLADSACTAIECNRLQTQLSHKEKLLSDFLENAVIGLHLIGQDGNILWANQAQLDLIGYTREEYIGQHIAKFHADKEVIEDILNRIAANETLQNYEARLRCKNGSLKHVLIDSNIVRENGELIHTQCFTRDISDRKKTEEERKRFFTLSLDMLCIAGIDGYFKQLNPAFEKTLNYSSAELLAQPFLNFVHPEDRAKTIAEVEKLSTGAPTINFENRYLCKNGSYKWLAWRAFPLVDEGSIYAIARDITESKNAEEALRESEERFRQITENIREVFWMVEPNRKQMIYVSPAYEEIWGNTCQSLYDRPCSFLNAIHPDDRQQVIASFAKQIQGEYDEEYRIIRPDGELRWVRSRAFPIRDSTGQVYRIAGISEDVTDRKQAEQKIREQAALLDIATDAIFVQDMSDRILFWNKGAERLYGWKMEEAATQNASALLRNEQLNYREIRETVVEKGEWQGELQQITKSGKKIIVQSRWTLVRDETAKAKSILIVNSDITEKKQLELQFFRTQRMESIGTLASGIAHDLNNVLAPILMAVQLLQIQLKDERSKRVLPVLETTVKRGADLIKQVLSFARGVDGDRALLQVNHLINEIKQIAKQTFPKSIELYIDTPQNIWTVFGDATQLHQVLMNLCVNARDAMPNGGTLSIVTENCSIDENYARMNIGASVGNYVVITVSDTGTGMASEIVERIFEPFFTTKELGKGTGLGLSTVMCIIKSHGGFVNVYSEVGKGTQFKVYLPAGEENETRQEEDLEIIRGRGELIFIVDDEAAIREITKISLETSGYKVMFASDGIEAIALYAQHKHEINLVLLDIMMPNMDGITTMRMLQKMNPCVNIVATSGLASNETIAATAGINFKVFLSKPYTAKELLKTINTALNSQSIGH